VTPLIAVLFGVLFGGETIGWYTALGGGAIIAGVALAVLRPPTRSLSADSESPPDA
jgi:drug/metabolite transporter (DMT)-like permease